jgi:WD40 repeat protein
MQTRIKSSPRARLSLVVVKLGRPGRGALAVFLLVSVLLAGCDIRRSPAVESTRQLQVADVQRIVEHPAVAPVAWAPDSRAFVHSGDHRVWVYSLERGDQGIAPVEVGTALSWSAALNLIALIDRGVVSTFRPDGSDRRVLDLPGVAVALAWAPGGDRMAIVLRRTGSGQPRYELWVANHDGGFKRLVTRAPAGRVMRDVQWFADSLYLLYGLSDPTAERIIREAHRVRISYPDQAEIPLPAHTVALRLAPTGRYVAVVTADRRAVGIGEVIVSRLDGSSRMVLAADPGRFTGLAWSPQGDKLVYAQVSEESRAELWVADADRSDRLHLYSYALEYTDPGIDLAVTWAPDARHLAFGTNTGTFVGPIWLATLQRR